MTTSNSVDFSVNRDEVIRHAMLEATILGVDQTPNADDISDCAFRLNLLVKQLQGKADFGANLKVFARKTSYLFLQQDQVSYSLGPSGDHWTASYSTTTTAAAKSASATSLTLSSAIGANSDNIGIVLDDGSIGWTTISSGGGTTSLTLPANTLGAAASGARVFTYTTKGRRPLQVLTQVLRDTDTKDQQMGQMSRQAYEALADKLALGTPMNICYEATLTDGSLLIDSNPDDVTKVIRMVFLGAPEDFDAITDTPDYPQEWFRPLVKLLAVDIAPMYGKVITQDMRDAAIQAIGIAQNTDPETSEIFFEPGRE